MITISINFAFENIKELQIITDFKKASINGINDVFPFVICSVYFFHFSHIWHLQKEESMKYVIDIDFNLIYQHLPILTFLPVKRSMYLKIKNVILNTFLKFTFKLYFR